MLFFGLWIAGGEGQGGQSAAAGWPPVETAPLDTRPLVVLDAGHGGFDPGAVDQSGTLSEMVLNQEMVDKVFALLAKHQDELLFVQAHQPGSYATPMARANTASELNADLLVSLHLNADYSPATRGFQCFPAPPGRVHHPESTRFAQLLVERVRPTGAQVMGENGIFYAYYLRRLDYEKVIVDSAQADPAELWEDESFGVVDYPGCPAVLVEMWHISSPADMAQFYTEAGTAAMAEAVYLAICDYFELQPKPA